MRKFGLIGKTLQHSYSQRWFESYFAAKGICDAEYNLWEMESLEGLRGWIAETGCEGFNVTLPYKRDIVPLLDAIDDDAQEIGAVNCVSVEWQRDSDASCGREGFLLRGHNTDWRGFLETLQPLLEEHHRRALILGTGGAAQAVRYALGQLGIAYKMVSRSPEAHPGTVGYGEAFLLAESHQLIVNTTPVGMFPNDAETPWKDLHSIGMQHLCYDLIYNPEETRWMLECELAGATVINGLEMLHRQAELSWEIFKGNF